MILYNVGLRELASFDYNDSVSSKTGVEFTYSYYMELCKKRRNHELDDDQYYDFEVCRFKYDINMSKL